jgi:hypothetical protein
MKYLWKSSFVVVVAVLLPLAACTRQGPNESGEVRGEPVGTATLQLRTLVVEPKSEGNAKIVRPAPPSDAPSAPEAHEDACPLGMALIEGEFCPDAEHTCLEWMDPPESRYAHFRCKRYSREVTCKSPKVHKRYCIDVTERVEPGTSLPRHFMSWTSSKALCESEGGRLCRESEWIFACEGEEMRPYPYGWERDETACNTDITEGIGKVGRLNDRRAEVGSHARCASPFGVQDMAGNVEEWTQADGPGRGSKMGWKEVLKGSWWIPSRHACRQFQVGHNDVYNGGETGTRCCKDAPPREVASR